MCECDLCSKRKKNQCCVADCTEPSIHDVSHTVEATKALEIMLFIHRNAIRPVLSRSEAVSGREVCHFLGKCYQCFIGVIETCRNRRAYFKFYDDLSAVCRRCHGKCAARTSAVDLLCHQFRGEPLVRGHRIFAMRKQCVACIVDI